MLCTARSSQSVVGRYEFAVNQTDPENECTAMRKSSNEYPAHLISKPNSIARFSDFSLNFDLVYFFSSSSLDSGIQRKS